MDYYCPQKKRKELEEELEEVEDRIRADKVKRRMLRQDLDEVVVRSPRFVFDPPTSPFCLQLHACLARCRISNAWRLVGIESPLLGPHHS